MMKNYLSDKIIIVTKLLEQNYITYEEAAILLREVIYIEKQKDTDIVFGSLPTNLNNDQVYNHWEHCSCNPKNGGSGICGCILGRDVTYSIR